MAAARFIEGCAKSRLMQMKPCIHVTSSDSGWATLSSTEYMGCSDVSEFEHYLWSDIYDAILCVRSIVNMNNNDGC